MNSKWLLCSLLLANASSAAVFRVGTDVGCTHNSLPAALAAAEAHPDATSIIQLATNGNYANTHLQFDAEKHLFIRGGYSTCNAAFNPATRVTLSGAGSPGPVIDVLLPGTPASASVSLNALIIRDGNDFSGGGIKIRGGSVSLVNSEVRANTGTLGAGILVAFGNNKGNPGALRLENSFVIANTGATLGGGIYCDDAQINIVSGDIVENQATDGGGAYLTSFCRMQTVGGGFVRLRNNQATNAGGGAYLNLSAQFVNAQDQRVFIDGNTAQFGGALYIEGSAEGSPTLVSLQYAWIRNNPATIAGVTVQGRSRFELRGGAQFLRCENGDYCTRISDHAGGALLVDGTAASLLLERVAVQNNSSATAGRGAVLAATGSVGSLQILESLITGNQGANLVTLELSATSPQVQLNASTVTANNVSGSVFSKNAFANFASMSLSHSIVFNSSPLNPSAAAAAVTVVGTPCPPLVNEIASIGGAGRIGINNGLDANFVPVANGPAADTCATTSSALDLNSRPRAVDLPVANQLGPQDLGAIERQDDLFRDGFE